MKDLNEKIKELNEGQIELVSQFVEKITKTEDLLPVFEDKLKTIKNNPIDEPKIAKKQKEIEELAKEGEIDQAEILLEIIEAVYTVEEIEALESEHNIEIKDLIKFGGAITEKVFGYKETVNGEEIFKEITSQDNLKPVPYSKKREIREQHKKYTKAINVAVEATKNQTPDLEELKALEAEIKKQEKLLDIKINEGCNLDMSEMTDWEKELLKQKVIGNSFGAYMPPVGKK